MKGQLIFNTLLLVAYFGFTISNEHQRIINGNFAAPKQFPYQVVYDSLNLSDPQEPMWELKCGGTFISKRIILTAAHCLNDPSIYALKIYFGAVDKSNSNEVGQQQLVVKGNSVVIHSEYNKCNSVNSCNDIALIKLPIDVAFDEYVRPAKLPQPNINYDSSEAIASGWGAVEVLANGTLIRQSKLKYFHTSILSHAECKKTYQKGVTMKIGSSQICNAPSQNTPCFGDSGGPLAVRHKADFVVLGIASYVSGKNCPVNTPSVYTRVASYINWIHENAGPHNLDE